MGPASLPPPNSLGHVLLRFELVAEGGQAALQIPRGLRLLLQDPAQLLQVCVDGAAGLVHLTRHGGLFSQGQNR